jgi:hypothetical protein
MNAANTPSKPSPTLRAAKFCVLRQGEMTAGDLACTST